MSRRRTKNELCNLCKQTMLQFFADIRENVFTKRNEIKDIVSLEAIFNQLHPETAMDKVIRYVLPHKDQIESKNVEFFISSKGLYKDAKDDDMVDYYMKQIGSGNRVSEEDKDTAFEYFKTIVALAEEYKKNE